MKELDKSKRYDLSELNSKELKEIWVLLKKNDIDWFDCEFVEVINKSGKSVLYFNGSNWEWDNTIKLEEATNAKELFEPQYEVTMIVEQPNDFKQITDSIASLLQYKNEKYGNSALEPLNVFQGKCKVGQRLDDKLARIKNNDTLQKNDVADLIGYLFLVCKENNWNNFDEFKD